MNTQRATNKNVPTATFFETDFKLIPTDFSNRKGFSLELNLRKKKWVLCCSYSPHNNFIETHMDSIGKVIDSLSARCENFI